MSTKPFSLYDFLGYAFPGAFTLLGGAIVLKQYDYLPNIFKLFSIESEFIDSNYVSIVNIFIVVLLSYIIGHIISYLSSMTIEKLTIWYYGYPSRYLLKKQKDNKKQTFFFEIDKNWSCNEKILCIFKRIVVLLAFLPYAIIHLLWDKALGMRHHYTRSLDNDSIDFLRSRLIVLSEKLVYSHSDGDESVDKVDRLMKNKDMYHILLHYEYDKSKNHFLKLDYYVVCYGFLRSICLSLIIDFWLILWLAIINGRWEFPYIYMVVLMISAYLIYLDYLKFFRKFTVETLYCFLSDEDLNKYEPSESRVEGASYYSTDTQKVSPHDMEQNLNSENRQGLGFPHYPSDLNNIYEMTEEKNDSQSSSNNKEMEKSVKK